MDNTLSAFMLPVVRGGGATADVSNVPLLTRFGFQNVHFGLAKNAAGERADIIQQRKREGASGHGVGVGDKLQGVNFPVIAMGLAALGFVLWRAK